VAVVRRAGPCVETTTGAQASRPRPRVPNLSDGQKLTVIVAPNVLGGVGEPNAKVAPTGV
jgi:hypothetical protein